MSVVIADNSGILIIAEFLPMLLIEWTVGLTARMHDWEVRGNHP